MGRSAKDISTTRWRTGNKKGKQTSCHLAVFVFVALVRCLFNLPPPQPSRHPPQPLPQPLRFPPAHPLLAGVHHERLGNSEAEDRCLLSSLCPPLLAVFVFLLFHTVCRHQNHSAGNNRERSILMRSHHKQRPPVAAAGAGSHGVVVGESSTASPLSPLLRERVDKALKARAPAKEPQDSRVGCR